MDPEPQQPVPGTHSGDAGQQPGIPLAGSVPGIPGVPGVPPQPPSPHDASMQSFVNSIMDQSPHLANAVPPAPTIIPNQAAVPGGMPAAPPPPPPIVPASGNPPKKNSKMGVLLATILLLLITLPIGVYYVSQQQTRVTEQRSCAAGGSGACITPGPYADATAPPEYCKTKECCQQFKDRTCFWFESSKTCKCTAPTNMCSTWGDWDECHNDSCICVQTRYCLSDASYYQIRQCDGCGPCGSPTVPHTTTEITDTPRQTTHTSTPRITSTSTPTVTGTTNTPTVTGTTNTPTVTGTTNTPTVTGTTNTPTVTATVASTATSTPTATGTPNPLCDSSCESDSDCPSDLKCYQIETGVNRCRKESCPSQANCSCPSATATPTPKSPYCNASCSQDTDCPNNMVCYSGSCRNSTCLNETDCTCPGTQEVAQSPTPKVPISGIPSLLGISTVVGSILLLIIGIIL